MKFRNAIWIIGCLLLFTGCSNAVSSSKRAPKNTAAQSTSQADSFSLKGEYFNKIKNVNGKNVIRNPTNILVLVNQNYSLPAGYIPPDLVRPNVAFSFGDQKLEKGLLRKEAASALEKMFSDAKKSGIVLYGASGYRSYSRQKALYNTEVSRVGKVKASQAEAIPGTSEHQTGLAIDIASKSTNLLLTEGFGDTKEGKWLYENAHRYGFILRYQKGKEGITNYEYEPWHFRYVGVRVATTIYEHNWTLEEYFNKAKKI
ncbi:D-alanyl-D-alanine carboxypeptidase family protein [Bacillus sp. EB600]|uniref:M15 family metallopeptidase n=1 Tax=Bacillus sp. EB600 TaxID=2806345 RepID=UPI00210EDB47|nr:M15 family metallopeptidase [Bacillus sp. EB600]MCQ6282953.1 M15 family metallopeptidase [Bacillus sp. EB600]